jgi:hypothetical protein
VTLPPGWITLFEAIDRLCHQKFQLEYLKLVKSSKSSCRSVFRDLEHLLRRGTVPTKLIVDSAVMDFTVFDMHLSPFRINFDLRDWPGIEVARNKDRLSNLWIEQKGFELTLSRSKGSKTASNSTYTLEERVDALYSLLVSEMNHGVKRSREDVRKQAQSDFDLSRADADKVRQRAARATGNEQSLKGGRPKR